MNTAKELIKTLGELEGTIASFTQEEINTVPFDGSWTPGQVARHLIKSYGVTELMTGNVAPGNRQPDANFGQIAGIFLDFESKFQSPEFIVPENQDYNKDELTNTVAATREKIEELTNELDLTMLCLDFELPGAGSKFTRLEWLYMMLTHTQRHIRQLYKIKKALQVPIV